MTMKFDPKKYRQPGDAFVESGLWKCEGVQKALRAGFRPVVSIEFVPAIYNHGKQKLRGHIGRGSVHLVQGDSAEKMPDALALVPKKRIVFWLDGHYQGKGDRTKNPLYAELEAIRDHHDRNDHTIMIDDRRLWGRDTWDIDEDKLRALMLEINPAYKFRYDRGVVPKDVLIAYPPEKK